jgi:Protein of unknown function (DUF3096)
MLEPNGTPRVIEVAISAAPSILSRRKSPQPQEKPMTITAAHITPLVALIAGILILIMPRLLNFIVAIYLIIVGLMGLNAIYHFVQ